MATPAQICLHRDPNEGALGLANKTVGRVPLQSLMPDKLTHGTVDGDTEGLPPELGAKNSNATSSLL